MLFVLYWITGPGLVVLTALSSGHKAEGIDDAVLRAFIRTLMVALVVIGTLMLVIGISVEAAPLLP